MQSNFKPDDCAESREEKIGVEKEAALRIGLGAQKWSRFLHQVPIITNHGPIAARANAGKIARWASAASLFGPERAAR